MKRVYLANVSIVILADDDDETLSADNLADEIDGALDRDMRVVECVIAPAKVEVRS